MSITNLGNGKRRIKVKTGYDPETGEPTYFDTKRKVSHEEAKRIEAEHTLFDRSKFSQLSIESYAITIWLPAIKEEVATNTYKFYEGTLKRHVFPYIGHEVLGTFNVPKCKAYFLQLPEKNRTCARKALSSLLSYAAEDDLIPLNPIKLLSRRTKCSKAKRKRSPYKTFSMDERLSFYRAVEGTIIEAVCLVMLGGGARREEGCALDWEQFDWERSCAPVERAYVVVSGSGECEMKEPKNEASWRNLYFSGYESDRLYTLSLGQSGPICMYNGERMRPDYLNKLFNALCNLYGLPPINVSHLRHTFATHHIKGGTDPATLRDLMGHTSISTIIDNYLLPLEEDKQIAQARLAEHIDPRTVALDDQKGLLFS